MVTDKGFYVENYVGTYRMEFCKDLNTMVIVSNECICPGPGEKALKKKRLFEYSARDNDYLYIALANVNIDSDPDILDYCNKYGLPYSSQLIYEKSKWLGSDVDIETVNRLAQADTSSYYKNDMMTKNGFCEAVVIARRLMELRTMISQKDFTDSTYTQFVSILIFFTFFSHINHYDHTPDAYALPRERFMRFQYEFQRFCVENGWWNGQPGYYAIVDFLAYIEREQRFVEDIESEHIQADISSTGIKLAVSSLGSLLYSRNIDGGFNFTHSFTYDSFGNVKFQKELTYNNDQNDIENLRKLGVELFRSVVNEGLEFITPSLSFEDEGLHGDWKLSYQMSGIYMELFLEASSNALVRQCANPTCGHYFSASRSDPRKRYCCHECAVLEAKRRERRKKKERKGQE